MPYAAPHPCSVPWCQVLVAGPGRCPAHQQAAWQAADEHRNSARERGYDAAWNRLRNQVQAEEPFCRMCEAEGRLTLVQKDDPVDHIIPIAERPDLRLVRSNLQSLCWPCHGRKSAGDKRLSAKRLGVGQSGIGEGV